MANNKIDYPLVKLLQIYKSRVDLHEAFPEVYDGELKGLLQWVLKHGIKEYSSKKGLLQHKVYYKKLVKQSHTHLFSKIALGLLTEEQTIWDNSEEQYIRDGFKIYWETLDEILHYQNECGTGNPDIDFVDFSIQLLKERSSGPNLSCCMIGCDEMGRSELRFDKSALFDEIVVMDIAKGLLAKQEALAREEGFSHIKYVREDFNSFKLKENYFDLIFARGTVHHIDNLEHFFLHVQRSLTTDGLFVMREYVGPKRIQFTDDQLQITNALLQLLPQKYRMLPDGTVKDEQVRPSSEELISIDPSESIRSDELMDVMKKYLETVLFSPTGGTILHPLLSGISYNFEKDDEGRRLLRALIELEKAFISSSLLPSDYVFVVAEAKG